MTASVPVTVIPDKKTFASPANCYIVTTADTYAFKAVKGNSSESVGNVASAEVLWESFGTDVAPAVGDLVKDVSYKDGEITFKATDKKGNAVIAAKDASGKILWSWHIWMTDQPKEQEYNHYAGTMMDRNLGAISTTPGDAGTFGLIYQWGRKDPFLGAYTADANAPAKSTNTWHSAVSSDSSNGTIEYATANPTTFIKNSSNNEDWYYTGSSDVDLTRWTESSSSKSIYDPCPAGWRVPDGGDQGIWSIARGSSSDFENSSIDWSKAYMDFSGIFGSESILYPTAGIYSQYTGNLTNVRSAGKYWSASKAMNSSRAKCLTFDYNGAVSPSNNTTRATGCSVRCVKE